MSWKSYKLNYKAKSPLHEIKDKLFDKYELVLNTRFETDCQIVIDEFGLWKL